MMMMSEHDHKLKNNEVEQTCRQTKKKKIDAMLA